LIEHNGGKSFVRVDVTPPTIGSCGHPVYGMTSCQACESIVERAAKALFAIHFAEETAAWLDANWPASKERFREAALALRDLNR
jgi:hypothetical protein